MADAPLPFISVAVPTHNRRASLLRCLDSILRQNHPPSRMELIIVDDGSIDGTEEVVSHLFEGLAGRGFARLILKRNEKPAQSAAARNKAFSEASPQADWILASDDDAVMKEGSLEALLNGSRDPNVGMLGPAIFFLSEPERIFSCANFVSPWSCRTWERNSPVPMECHWLTTTLCLVRGEAFRRCGNLYPGYDTAYEDVDFCLRVRRAGYRVLYLPQAIAYHDVAPNYFRKGSLYYLYRNKYILIRRNFFGLKGWTALAFHSLFGFSWALLRLFMRTLSGKRHPEETVSTICRAFRDGLLDRRGFRETK